MTSDCLPQQVKHEILFDEVLILNRRAVAFGPVQEVFTEANLALAYG